MTLVEYHLFNPYLYLATQKQRDPARWPVGDLVQETLDFMASCSNSVPHAFDCSSYLSQNWKLLDNGSHNVVKNQKLDYLVFDTRE